jgi:hypothetical protein
VAELLACRRGSLVVMEGCEGIPGKVNLEDFEPMAAIIVSPSVEDKVNSQFQSSLKRSVYIYVFGDNMGVVTIDGIAFATRCENNASGLKEVFDYYRDYRASQRKEPITVTFGEESISGFLTASNITPRDPDYIMLNFSFVINTLPREASE